MKPVRIATRGSDLALWQARHVASRIESALGRETEIVPLSTQGDRMLDVSLAKVGGKGLFVKEIEQALLDERADVAVHSAKDLPGLAPEALCFAAFPERADPRDALITRVARGLDDLKPGARVGTGSVRRTAQLLRERPDLEIVPLRGNVPTRLAKLESERLDAVVLACAGLDRLELAHHIRERIDPARLVPAVGQGALAVQARRDDSLAEALSALDHADTRVCVTAERACQGRLEADCNVPVAAYARLYAAGQVTLEVRLLAPDGSEQVACTGESAPADAARLGTELAERALAAGGGELLERARQAEAT